jgi:hypothetical protein
MINATTTVPHNMSRRQAICDYLSDLPALDRQVLFQRYAKKEGLSSIASSLHITSTHVEHIVRRTDEFRQTLLTRQRMSAPA